MIISVLFKNFCQAHQIEKVGQFCNYGLNISTFGSFQLYTTPNENPNDKKLEYQILEQTITNTIGKGQDVNDKTSVLLVILDTKFKYNYLQ